MDGSPLNKAKTHRNSMPGVIAPGELYAADELRGRMRWTASAMRAAKKAGLKVARIGKRDYVLGQAVIDFVRDASK